MASETVVFWILAAGIGSGLACLYGILRSRHEAKFATTNGRIDRVGYYSGLEGFRSDIFSDHDGDYGKVTFEFSYDVDGRVFTGSQSLVPHPTQVDHLRQLLQCFENGREVDVRFDPFERSRAYLVSNAGAVWSVFGIVALFCLLLSATLLFAEC